MLLISEGGEKGDRTAVKAGNRHFKHKTIKVFKVRQHCVRQRHTPARQQEERCCKGGGVMQFPRKTMSITELVRECGLPRYTLECIAHAEGQKCAFRRPGGRKIYFDTEKLGKQLERYTVR